MRGPRKGTGEAGIPYLTQLPHLKGQSPVSKPCKSHASSHYTVTVAQHSTVFLSPFIS